MEESSVYDNNICLVRHPRGGWLRREPQPDGRRGVMTGTSSRAPVGTGTSSLTSGFIGEEKE
jgi:hypothetical protein